MFQNRGPVWIGFQEAQKSITILKEEVEIAERKLLNAKRSISSTKGSSQSVLSNKPSHIEFEYSNRGNQFKRHFVKETLLNKPELKTGPIQKENVPFEKIESSSATEDKPKPRPFKIPDFEPKELQQALTQSSTPTFSNSDTSNFAELQYSSSASTSSLIAGLSENKELKYARTRHKAKSSSDASKIVFSSWEKMFLQEEEVGLDSQISSASETVPPAKKSTSGIEWKIVPAGKKPSFNRNSSKSHAGFQKLKDIIERQKKKFEASNLESDDDVVVNHRKFLRSSPMHEHKKLPEKSKSDKTLQVGSGEMSEIPLLPLRKKCLMTTHPAYKGFSYPGVESSSYLKGKVKKKIKTTEIASQNVVSKRKKVLVRPSKNTTSLWRKSDQVILIQKPVQKPKISNNKECDTVKSIPEHSKSSSTELSSQGTVSNHIKHSTEENVESVPAVADTSDPTDRNAKIAEQLKSLGEDTSELTSAVNSKQSNTTDNFLSARKPKSIKRKAIKPPEQIAPSPKVRHYDVEKVRDYMQKKKIERKRRHQEEHKKRLLEAQKKEESLQKLYQHQKQSVKTVFKDKILSPVKVSKLNKIAIVKIHPSDTPAVLNAEEFQKGTSKRNHGTNAIINNEGSESQSARVKQSVQSEVIKEPTKDVSLGRSNEEVIEPGQINDAGKHLISATKADDNDMPSKRVYSNEMAKDNSSANCSYVSTISTPTELSKMSGIDKSLIRAMKEAKVPPPPVASRQCETLRNLMKSIDELIEPYEYFLRTKKWVEESPPPPSLKDSEKTESSAGTVTNKVMLQKTNCDFKLEIAKSLGTPKDNSIFMERVSDIGDLNQLYSRMLNKDADSIQTVVEAVENSIKQNSKSVGSDGSVSDDDLIEGSLLSDEENVGISAPKETQNDQSVHKSSSNILLLNPQKIPDPFNVINTWQRKPLDLLQPPQNYQAESENSFSKLSHEQSELSMAGNYTSDFPTASVSDQSGLNDNSSRYTQNKLVDESSKQAMPNLEMKSFASHSEENQTDLSKALSSSHIHSSLSGHNSDASESLISGSINSEGSKENSVVELQEKKIESSASNSESVISEVISIVENANGRPLNSDETIINENRSNSSQGIVSLEPAVSEISDKTQETNSCVKSDESIHSILKSHRGSEISSDKNSAQHSSVNNGHEISQGQDEISVGSNGDKVNRKSLSVSSSNGVALNSEHSLRKEDTTHLPGEDTQENVLNASAAVPSTITIDFTQPVRLTLSSRIEEPLLIKQHMPSENEQYLQSQIVRRVASEAAAAAAKSAVTEILKSQKSVSSKRHPFKISVMDSSSSSMKSKSSSEYVRSEKSTSKQSKSNGKEAKRSMSYASSKHDEIIEEIHSGSNEEIMEQSSSVELEDLSAQKSSLSSSSKVAEMIESVSSDVNAGNSSEKISERSSKRKISGNLSSPSPASLSDNESISSATMISSQSADSDFSQQNESDDSFAQLTLDVVKRMTHDEQLRARQQLSFLQMQEKALVEKARAEMMWLEQLKKKLRKKTNERKVNAVKKHQKEIILRLRQERAQLQCMQEAYRSICEKNQPFLEDKKKLLKEPMSLACQILNKKEKGHSSKLASQDKLKEVPRAKSSSSSTPTVISNDEQIVEEEGVTSEAPEMLRGLASNSSQESVIEQIPEQTKSSIPSYNKSYQSSPSAAYSPSNAGQSSSNMIQPGNSLDSTIHGLKKLEASKRHLTKREQRILQRRKHVESLLQWHKKLDSEEMAVRELEQKALELVDHSKKKTKYYVSSTSTDLNNMKKMESNTESAPPPESKINFSSQKTSSDVTSSIKNASSSHAPSSKESTSIVEENNSGSSSGNGVEEDLSPDKGSSGAESYVTTATSSLKEDIKSGSSATSVHTVDAPVENSVGEEIISDEVSSNVISPSIKDRSSNSDVYSESFESTTSRKSILLSPLSFRNASPKQSLKKDSGLGIRAPLVPRTPRRHDSSGSDDSYTISHSETASDQSDIEVRIHALAEELRRRKAEAEKLKRDKKKKYREQLKEKELSLQKQIEAYNQYIQQAKLDLEHQIESAVSLPQTSDATVVKPQIKWPRPEKILESRRLRKQAPYVHDALSEKKCAEVNGSSPESVKSFSEKSPESRTRSEIKTSALPSSVQELSSIKTRSSSFINNIATDIKELSNVGDQSKDSAGEISSIEVETSEIISDHSGKSQAQSNDSTNLSLEKSVEDIADKHEKSFDNVTESKSDTFVSETASPSNHTSNEKHADDSLSHRSSSAGEDGNYSEEFVDDHDSDQSHDSNRTVLNESTASSEMESSSEAHSVVNTGSIDEEVDTENFKCDSSSGCPAPQSDAVTKNLIVPDKKTVPQDVTKSSISQVPFSDSKSASGCKKPLKKVPNSELFVVNVANYVCSLILDEAVKTIIFLKRKNINSNHLETSNKNNKSEIAIKNSSIFEQNKNTKVLEIVDNLMDRYLTDAVLSIVKTYQIFKSKYLQIKNENKYTVSEVTEKSGSNSEINLPEQNADFPVLGGNYEQEKSKYPQTLQDLNDNSIFNKSVNWLDGAFLPAQNEFQVQQLEQQLLIQQQYSFYYRKIPNKPPPPYTPPSAGASTVSLVRDKHITKVQDIKSITENISYVLDHIVDVLLDGKKQGVLIKEISAPKLESIAERFELHDASQVIFIDLIFDVTKEILQELFSETDPEPQPWLRTRKLTSKPAFPMEKNRLMKVLEKEVQVALKLTSDNSTLSQRKQTLWSAMKLGRKKRDFVDTILIKELKEEEPEWVNYDQDEVTVKFQIADYILNLLVDDTVKVFKTLQHKCYG